MEEKPTVSEIQDRARAHALRLRSQLPGLLLEQAANSLEDGAKRLRRLANSDPITFSDGVSAIKDGIRVIAGTNSSASGHMAAAMGRLDKYHLLKMEAEEDMLALVDANIRALELVEAKP